MDAQFAQIYAKRTQSDLNMRDLLLKALFFFFFF